jgi:Protein of unknown function (DUF2971)
MAANNEQWEHHDAAFEKFKAEIGQLIENQLNAAGETSSQAQTIYHYTDVRSALAIIESGHFWFTERAHLNDTLELQYGLRIGHQMFEAAVRKAGPTVPQQAPDHLMGEVGLGLVEYGYWVASFSYVDDDMSQWRSYADDGRGICLGFSVQALDMRMFASNIPATFNFLRFPVRYDESELRTLLQPYVDATVNLLLRVNLPSMPSYSQRQGRALLYERDVLQTMMSGFWLQAMMHKHRAYQHEQEYRLILNAYRPKIEPDAHHKVRVRSGEVVGYLDLPIPNWKRSTVLACIKVGPAAPPMLEEQLATALRSFELSVPKIKRSALPFRATR